MSNLFDEDFIVPMELSSKRKPFNDKNYLFEIKFDGIRCLAKVKDNKLTLVNRRNKILTSYYPELHNIYKQVKGDCILDGELVCFNKQGEPDFNLIQGRSLTTNKLKVKFNSKLYPVTFVVYDILNYNGEDLVYKPLIERKHLIESIINENNFLMLSRYIFENGIELYKKVKSLNLEGIVAKKITGTYVLGARKSNNWIKIKNLKDEDFVICGYITTEEEGIAKVILGQYNDEKELIFRDVVYMGFSKYYKQILQKAEKSDKPIFYLRYKNITWLKPKLVCTVEYMLLSKNKRMRQPLFKGIRDDKKPTECKLFQLIEY